MDESVLVEECLKGKSAAQRYLFEKFSPKMMTICLRYFSNKTIAEDVLQDGFIKVFKNLAKFKGGSLEGWIRRILVNTSLDQIRKDKKFKDNISVNDEPVYNKCKIEDPSAMDEVFLLDLIDKLPEHYKIIFNLFAIEGFSHKEISKQLGITENTSKSQYLRARLLIIKKLEKLNFER